MVPGVLGVVFALAALSSGGCAALDASSAISDTSTRVAEAKRNGAEKYARYEYHKAVAFLDEAKIKNGYGEYQQARLYADQAMGLAQEANQAASRRRELELRRLRGKQKFNKRFKRPKRPLRPPEEQPKVAPPTQPQPERPQILPPTQPRPKRPQILPPQLQPKAKPSGGGN